METEDICVQQIRKILFVSHGIRNETEALNQAFRLAHEYQAKLMLTVICPRFSNLMKEQQTRQLYRQYLQTRLQEAVETSCHAQGLGQAGLQLHIEVEPGGQEYLGSPAVRIIRQVLNEQFDLVIMQAETDHGESGFKAIDMELLRKCPCPVWLCRPSMTQSVPFQIAVAIDPVSIGLLHNRFHCVCLVLPAP